MNNIYKTSNLFFPTIKNIPEDIKLSSHKLMLKAGIINQTASGIYTLLPLGVMAINKLQFIIRNILNEINCQEILMPILQPKNLWTQSKRWDKYGSQLFTLKDRHNRQFCLGPTHEEIITILSKYNILGYKQLPITLYQIQTKFRDEYRPKFGLIRLREFIMKDAYSFHMNKNCLNYTYNNIRKSYIKLLNKFNLDYRIVLANSGEIGGNLSEEFHILSKAGEDNIAISNKSTFASNIELAIPGKIKKNLHENFLSKKYFFIKYNKIFINYKKYIKNNNIKIIKTILVKGNNNKFPIVGIIIKKNHQINLLKLTKYKIIKNPLQIIKKFININNIKNEIPIIIDKTLTYFINLSHKINNKNTWILNIPQLINLNTIINDIRYINNLDTSPCGKGKITITKGIEIGHIFKLGNKYSTLMKSQIVNKKNIPQYLEMGCYGIGISRLLAVIIEQTHDKYGIIFPNIIAPFNVVIIPINLENENIKNSSINLYKELKNRNIDTIIENRKINIKKILSEIDLIGIPHRIIINEKNYFNNKYEYKSRYINKTFSLTKLEILNIICK